MSAATKVITVAFLKARAEKFAAKAAEIRNTPVTVCMTESGIQRMREEVTRLESQRSSYNLMAFEIEETPDEEMP